MKTTISWDGEEPKDWSEENFGPLPERYFECDRLEKGDQLSFDIALQDGGSQEYFAKVTKVDINLSWTVTGSWDVPVEVMQWVWVKG